MLYKVNEDKGDQTSASNICKYQYSRLMQIDSESKLKSLQNVIESNTILSKYVATHLMKSCQSL